MGDAGIDALVVPAPDSQYWLCGLESFIGGVLSQALIVPRDGETTLVMWDADEPLARETATVERIRSYRFGVDDPVDSIHAELGGAAVVGFDGASRAVPHELGRRLAEALAPARAEAGLAAAFEHTRPGLTERELAVVVGGTYAVTAAGVEQLAGAGPVALVTA